MSKIVVLIPAYNESESIGRTIEAVLGQTRQADKVVVIPNGCTDNTADVARGYPVTVMELPKLEHRKSEALNKAWLRYSMDFDYVITMDADTTFPDTAIEDWVKEMDDDPSIGGSTAKFTIASTGILSRMQKAEYAANIQTALNRGNTHVLAGAGTVFRNINLKAIVEETHRFGPWSHDSEVEDYELTYRLRERGLKTVVSPKVRGYTDGMRTIRALWGQRMKWQAGTVDDLIGFGVNKLTIRDWGQQLMGLLNVFMKLLLVTIIVGYSLLGTLQFVWFWWLLPILFIGLELKKVQRVPHKDWKDVALAATFIPNEIFMWLRTGWYVVSWASVLTSKITRVKKDYWAAQYTAEGV